MEKRIEVVVCCTKCKNEISVDTDPRHNHRYVEVPINQRYICLECGHDMKVVVRLTTSVTKTEII